MAGVGGAFSRPYNLPPPCEKCQRDRETCPEHGPGAERKRKVDRILNLIADLDDAEKSDLWAALEDDGWCLRCKTQGCGGWCDYSTPMD